MQSDAIRRNQMQSDVISGNHHLEALSIGSLRHGACMRSLTQRVRHARRSGDYREVEYLAQPIAVLAVVPHLRKRMEPQLVLFTPRRAGMHRVRRGHLDRRTAPAQGLELEPLALAQMGRVRELGSRLLEGSLLWGRKGAVVSTCMLASSDLDSSRAASCRAMVISDVIRGHQWQS